MKDVRIKSKQNPWMNSHILSGIKRRNGLYARFKKNRTNTDLFREFCKVRNAVQRDIKFAKENFFKTQLNRCKGNSGKLWRHLASLGHSSNVSSSRVVLEENGDKIFDSKGVARVFNLFYSSVASNLVAKLPSPFGVFDTSCQIFRDFYHEKLRQRPGFTLSPVPSHFVRKQLCSLDPKKAVGLDGVSSLFLRDGADFIFKPIQHLINLSIITESVPDLFKEAKVVPLFKKGSTLDPGNYRPVSVLSVLSKILERAVHTQLAEYLEKRSILFENQSGFRGGFSTDTSLIGLTDFVRTELSKGRYVGMVLIDLCKAFDTVDHSILIEKLRAVGVTSLSWFKSYLAERRQCVEICGVRSDFLPMTCGVPQGSILGPLLFLVYINDLSMALNCRLSLYADDSALIFSDAD